MSLLKKIYYRATAALPTQFVQQISKPDVLLPYHHLVSDKEVLHTKYLYSHKNIQQFENDLDYLLRFFKPVSTEDLIIHINKYRSLPANSFLLSFDDGFREVHDIIAPILLRKGVPAVFFINPAFIDNKELFYRCKISLLIHHFLKNDLKQNNRNAITDLLQLSSSAGKNDIIYLLKKTTQLNKDLLDQLAHLLSVSFSDYLKIHQPFLSTEQLHWLKQKGFTIGGHSWDHPYYHLLPQEEQIKQTTESIKYIQKEGNESLSVFSFPHYDTLLKQSFFDTLFQQQQIDLLFGIQNQKRELNNKMIHRFNAERPEIPLQLQLNGLLLFMLLQKITGRNQVKRSE
jgi:peptidoglycan/xylan/chitin deacetylase (PgdA/CDA1 family)